MTNDGYIPEYVCIFYALLQPLDPKTKKHAGFKPSRYGLQPLKMRVVGSIGTYITTMTVLCPAGPLQVVTSFLQVTLSSPKWMSQNTILNGHTSPIFSFGSLDGRSWGEHFGHSCCHFSLFPPRLFFCNPKNRKNSLRAVATRLFDAG